MYDRDIRRALRVEVELAHLADPDTRIVDELGIRQGRVRIDLAVVNGVFKGYEIKSLVDTLRRLPTQVEVYGQVLDYATIVLAEQHREDALALLPSWWGVMIARQEGEEIAFELEREGDRNPAVSKRFLAELLWHEEALALLRDKGAHQGLSRRPRSDAWDRIDEVCTLAEVREAVRSCLKGRAVRRPVR